MWRGLVKENKKQKKSVYFDDGLSTLWLLKIFKCLPNFILISSIGVMKSHNENSSFGSSKSYESFESFFCQYDFK